MAQSERFGWLTAASSTIVQPSPIHTGLCDDPEALLDRLFTGSWHAGWARRRAAGRPSAAARGAIGWLAWIMSAGRTRP